MQILFIIFKKIHHSHWGQNVAAVCESGAFYHWVTISLTDLENNLDLHKHNKSRIRKKISNSLFSSNGSITAPSWSTINTNIYLWCFHLGAHNMIYLINFKWLKWNLGSAPMSVHNLNRKTVFCCRQTLTCPQGPVRHMTENYEAVSKYATSDEKVSNF